MARATFESIPVVSLRDGDEPALGDELRGICHEIGFFVAVDHGLPAGLIDEVFAMMSVFFALDDEQKLLIDKRASPHFRGWEAVGTERTNNRPDIREQIDLWSEWPVADPGEVTHHRLLGPNQWMPETMVPGQRELMHRWFLELGQLADRLLSLLSVGLGLGPNHLRDYFGAQPMALTKLINYPPTPAGAAGVNAHHDTGFLTLLAAGPTPGLQIQNPDGEWLDVPCHDGALVVNLGEMLQAVTGNYFVATPHRVITDEPRMSAGYFHGPSLDTRLDPLPLAPEFAAAVQASDRHRRAGFMAQADETSAGVGDMQSPHRPDTFGAQLWNYFARSYPEMMARHHGDLA